MDFDGCRWIFNAIAYFSSTGTYGKKNVLILLQTYKYNNYFFVCFESISHGRE